MNGLVRHHPLIRVLPRTLAVAMAMSSVGFSILLSDSLVGKSRLGIDRGDLFELVLLLGGLFLLVLKETGRRSTPWAQALPVDARTLWTGHVHALFLASSLVILAMAVVVTGLSALVQRFEAQEHLAPAALLVHFARPWLLMLAVALVMGSWWPDLADPHRAPGWNRRRRVLALGAVATLLLLQFVPLVMGIFPVAAAGIWAGRVRDALPPVLGLAEREEKMVGPDGAVVPVSGRRTLHWVVLRQLFKWPLTWIIGVPMTLLLGLVQGGLFSSTADADFARYFNLWITIYMMVAFVGHFLLNLHRVDHLPVSRQTLLGWLILPNLIALLLGGAVGSAIDAARPVGESLRFVNDYTQPYAGLQVPVDLWQPTWGEPPTTVTAPWGETGPASSVPVIDGLPLYLWKPYTTTADASADFVAWQIARAAREAYGMNFGQDEIRDLYLAVGADGAVGVRKEGLTLVGDFMGDGRRVRGPILGLLLAFTVNGALLTFWIIFALCGPQNTGRGVKWVTAVALASLITLHLGGYGLLASRVTRDWHLTALVEGMAGSLGAMGAWGVVLPWIVGFGFGLLLWTRCSRAFARVEAVREGSTSSC